MVACANILRGMLTLSFRHYHATLGDKPHVVPFLLESLRTREC